MFNIILFLILFMSFILFYFIFCGPCKVGIYITPKGKREEKGKKEKIEGVAITCLCCFQVVLYSCSCCSNIPVASTKKKQIACICM